MPAKPKGTRAIPLTPRESPIMIQDELASSKLRIDELKTALAASAGSDDGQITKSYCSVGTSARLGAGMSDGGGDVASMDMGTTGVGVGQELEDGTLAIKGQETEDGTLAIVGGLEASPNLDSTPDPDSPRDLQDMFGDPEEYRSRWDYEG